jgi:hypothetical protein
VLNTHDTQLSSVLSSPSAVRTRLGRPSASVGFIDSKFAHFPAISPSFLRLL